MISSVRAVVRIYAQHAPIAKFSPISIAVRYISLTAVRSIKEIKETVVEDVTVIEGVHVDDFRDHNLLEEAKNEYCCPLCTLNLNLHYTDVLILSQFMRPGRGTILPSRITGVCRKQQKKLDLLIYQAGKAGLFKKVFTGSRGTKTIMPKRGGYNLPRYY